MATKCDVADLSQALQHYEMQLPDDQIGKLSSYAELLWEWNEKLNLTRHTDVDKFVSRDVWDCWHLAKCLEQGEEVLDVGSGGGVPGLVLSILRPDLVVTVCDTVSKKARVLESMVNQLGLPVLVYDARAESLVDDLGFDSLVARAVGPLWKICRWFEDSWPMFGRLLTIKGPNWVNERGEARHKGLLQGVSLRKLTSYPMIGTESESVILQLSAEREESG